MRACGSCSTRSTCLPAIRGLPAPWSNSARRAGKFGTMSGVGSRLLMGIGEVGADAGRQSRLSHRLHARAERVVGDSPR
jgi:hypothetical protein